MIVNITDTLTVEERPYSETKDKNYEQTLNDSQNKRNVDRYTTAEICDNDNDYYSTNHYIHDAEKFCGFWKIFCQKCDNKPKLSIIKPRAMKHKSKKSSNSNDQTISQPVYEIPVYFGDLRKWVKGVDSKTLAQELIMAILTESGIDTDNVSEYFILAEEKQNSHALTGSEHVLPWWMRINENGGRLILSAQRLYVNLNNDKSQTTRQKLFHQLTDQMTILDKQRKKLAILDQELNKLNSNKCLDENRAAHMYNKLSEILAHRTKQIWICENKLGNSIPSKFDNQQLINELRNAEQTSNKLNQQLCSLQLADRELDRLLILKRKHCYEVERLIPTENISNSRISSIQGQYTFPVNDTQVCVASANPCKNMFDSNDWTCYNAHTIDDDSDTGVSSMNSDESVVRSYAGREKLQRTSNFPLETLV